MLLTFNTCKLLIAFPFSSRLCTTNLYIFPDLCLCKQNVEPDRNFDCKFRLCCRYKRKGISSLGLDSQRQSISWDDSETKKKRKGRDSKKSADRYYSTASRQLLRSEPPVPVKPPDGNDAFKATSFLPLGDVDKDNKGGTGLSLLTVNIMA